MPILEDARILDNKEVAPNHFKLTLFSPQISLTAQPGQFVNVRCSPAFDPLLRRPFSLHKIDKKKKTIDILFSVVGKGTRILSSSSVGTNLNLLGPLGNGFKIVPAKEIAILIAGGVGVAPLLSLAEDLKGKIKGTYAFLGARTRDLVLCEKEFRNLGCEVVVTTDDGSYGKKGLVSDFLIDFLNTQLTTYNLQLTTFYACGPKEMLKKIATLALERKLSCQISLEENMGCGLGACLGCVVKTKAGYKRVCTDGPVFEVSEIIWPI